MIANRGRTVVQAIRNVDVRLDTAALTNITVQRREYIMIENYDCADVFVGVGVGKGEHHAVAYDRAGKVLFDKALPNDETKLREVIGKLKKHGQVLFVVDQPATIGALPVAVAQAENVLVAYLPGLAMRRIADLHPGEAKTDARDAAIIAQAARTLPHALRSIQLADEQVAELSMLCGFDDDVLAQIVATSNRIRGLPHPDPPSSGAGSGPASCPPGSAGPATEIPLPSVDENRRYAPSWEPTDQAGTPDGTSPCRRNHPGPHRANGRRRGHECGQHGPAPPCRTTRRLAEQLAALRQQRNEIAVEVEKLVDAHPLQSVLISMPGVGVRTAARLLTEVWGKNFATAGHLASYAGLAPVTRRSGSSIRGEHSSRRGNKVLKRALFLSAFAALHDPASRAYYDRKIAEGKKHNQALLALARRRCNVIYAMMRDGTLYENEPKKHVLAA